MLLSALKSCTAIIPFQLQGLKRRWTPLLLHNVESRMNVPVAPNIPTTLLRLSKRPRPSLERSFCQSSSDEVKAKHTDTSALNVLKNMNQININQTEVLKRGVKATSVGQRFNEIYHNFSHIKLNISDDKDKVVFTALYNRGGDPSLFQINIFTADKDETHLVRFHLRRSPKYKTLKLQMDVPPGHNIGYAVDLPGIKPTVLIRNEDRGTILQLLASDSHGWTKAVVILNAKGSRRMGHMDRKNDYDTKLTSSEFHATIDITDEILTVPERVALIGCCMFLMGRYQQG